MDTASVLKSLLSASSLNSLSKETSSTKADVKSVLSAALPMVASKLATTKEGALQKLAETGTASQIVTKLVGCNAASTISKATGVDKSTTNTILSTLAPLLLQKLLGGNSSSSETSGSALSGLASGLLGSVLGGSSEKEEEKEESKEDDSSSGLLNLLGGLLK